MKIEIFNNSFKINYLFLNIFILYSHSIFTRIHKNTFLKINKYFYCFKFAFLFQLDF